MASVAESYWDGPPKNFQNLLEEVVDQDICTYCLLCMDACGREGCDNVSLVDDRFVYTPADCEGSGICYASCPEIKSLDQALESLYHTAEEGIGHVERAVSVMAADWNVKSKAGDGGAVPALVKYLLESGQIDAAVVPAPGGVTPTGLLLASEGEEAVTATGYKFKKPATTRFLRDLYRSREDPLRLALVANPCQVRMVRKMQLNNVPPSRDIRLIIGGFCYATLSNARWKRDFFERALGAEGRLLRSVQVGEEVRATFYDGTESRADLDDLYLAFDSSCLACEDYANNLADISVGPTGSPEGFETLLARTEDGIKALEGALKEGYLVEWSSLFPREDGDAFQEGLLEAVGVRTHAKEALAERRGR